MTAPAIETPRTAVPAPRGSYAQLSRGVPLPRIYLRWGGRRTFPVDSLGGRYIVLCFFGTASDAVGRSAVEAMLRQSERFTFERAVFFGISVDPQDEAEGRVREAPPCVRVGWDFERAASVACGAASADKSAPLRRLWLVVGPTLHVLSVFPFKDDDPDHSAVFDFLDGLPPPDRYAGLEMPAPVLILPHVFDAELCRSLIDAYDQAGGEESGVIRFGEIVVDSAIKRRKDVTITDQGILRTVQRLFVQRVCPEVERLFFMKAARMGPNLVACYAAEDGGHYTAHRDNTQPSTAHRRFAVSINLNSDFEGGEVCFPEYNLRGYKVPPGWAIVFPANILHRVSEVTAGQRYAFLPFIYAEAGKRM